MMQSTQCWVYKGPRQPEMYLYLPVEGDFARVPQPLMDQLGRLQLALNFELTPTRKLARVDPNAVLKAFDEQGFYLQMPPSTAKPSMAPTYQPSSVRTRTT